MNLQPMPGFNGPYNPDQYSQVPYYTDASGSPYTYEQVLSIVQPQAPPPQQPQVMYHDPTLQQPQYPQPPVQQPYYPQPPVQQPYYPQPPMNEAHQNVGNINGHELYATPNDAYTQDYNGLEPGAYTPPPDVVYAEPPEVTTADIDDEYIVTEATLSGKNAGCDICYNSLTHTVITAYNRVGNGKQYILKSGVEMKKGDHVQEVGSMDGVGYDVEATTKAIDRSVNSFVDSGDMEFPSRIVDLTFTGGSIATAGLMAGVKFKDTVAGGSVITTASVVTAISPQLHTDGFMDKLMQKNVDYNSSIEWYVELMNAGFGTDNPLSVGILNSMDKILMRYARGAVRVSINLPANVTGAYHTEHADIVDYLRTKRLDGPYKKAMYEVFKYKLNLLEEVIGDGADEFNIIAMQEDALLCYVSTGELDNVIAEGYLTHELFPEVRTACVRTAEASRNMDVPSSWFYITNGHGVTIEVRRDMTLAEANTSYRVMRVITQL